MRKYNRIVIGIIALQIVLLVSNGCYRKGENIPTNPPTATVLLEEAWQQFQSQEYDMAAETFKAAKDRDALQAEAFLGLGWTLSKLQNYTNAISNFRIMQSISKDEGLMLDSYAGLAVCFAAQGDDAATIENGLMVLEKSPSYSFSKDGYIDAKMIAIVVARSYVNNEDYVQALELVDSNVEPGFIASLINDGTVVQVDDMEIAPIIGANTPVSGEATLRIEKDKEGVMVPAELVKVLQVTSNDGNVAYSVLSFEQGGRDIVIKGNPVPKAGDLFKTDLLYANNFGVFLSKLYKKIESLKS